MVLINSIEHEDKRGGIQGPTRCVWRSFVVEGKAYLQLDTYGSESRKNTNVSQTIQFGEAGAAELKRLITSVFPNIG